MRESETGDTLTLSHQDNKQQTTSMGLASTLADDLWKLMNKFITVLKLKSCLIEQLLISMIICGHLIQF